MITDPLFFLVAIPAVLIVGISKGGFGGGLGLVAVPLLSLVVAPTQAAAIMLPILCVMDVIALWGFRGHYDKRNLRILLPAAAIGIGFGALSFQYLNDHHLKLMIGAVTLTFCVHWFWQKLSKHKPEPKPAAVGRGSFWGMLAGFTSFSVHAGGPPMSFYLLPQQLDKTLFVGTTVIFFATVNLIKLVPYSALGLLPVASLTTSLALVPMAIVGVKLGLYLHTRINQTWFYRICYGFLFVTGCKLSWEGVAAL